MARYSVNGGSIQGYHRTLTIVWKSSSGQETYKLEQFLGDCPGIGWVAKVFFRCFLVSVLMGEKKHINRILRKFHQMFADILLFLPCSLSLPTSAATSAGSKVVGRERSTYLGGLVQKSGNSKVSCAGAKEVCTGVKQGLRRRKSLFWTSAPDTPPNTFRVLFPNHFGDRLGDLTALEPFGLRIFCVSPLP